MSTRPDIAIFGTGALGTALARALVEQGYPVISLFNRTQRKARELARELNVPVSDSFPGNIGQIGDLLFLAVSDDAIQPTAHQLVNRLQDFSERTIVHCSGNHPADVLDALRSQGGRIASCHPVQTFHSASGAEAFKDIYVSLEGDQKAVESLERVFRELGTTPFTISREAKPFFHAAAVMASNYLVTLLNTAGRIAELGEIEKEKALRPLLPLAATTLENIREQDPPSALSGPIARGDVATVRKHLSLLEHNSGLLSLYQRLGLLTVELARKKGSISDEKARKLTDLLQPDEI